MWNNVVNWKSGSYIWGVFLTSWVGSLNSTLCLCKYFTACWKLRNPSQQIGSPIFPKWKHCWEARSEVEDLFPSCAGKNVLGAFGFSCSSDSKGSVTDAQLCFAQRKVRGHLFCCHQSRQRQCAPGANTGNTVSWFVHLSRGNMVLKPATVTVTSWIFIFQIMEDLEAFLVGQYCWYILGDIPLKVLPRTSSSNTSKDPEAADPLH